MSTLRPSTDNTLSYDSQGSTYVIHYFQNHGMTGAIRALLSLALNKDQWSNQFQDPVTWWNDKDKAPCGTLPILYETTSTGETITIPESDAIERYLARKYGYMGSTPWEETLVNIFHAQAMTVLVKWIQKVAWAIEGTREQAMESFLKVTLREWINTCEKQLRHNGSNGHFVGDMVCEEFIRFTT
ncbi:hypothetical protein K7432_015678 [Basidiobolus ranarum]|uniref:GST N-terminal domain-containing protein n=1 Tax=Basidiobolus ranarum TaxID=34480 RepID=A0ABR2WFS5_9FUNG